MSLKEEADKLEKRMVAYNYEFYMKLIREADVIISRDEERLVSFKS